MWVRCGWEAGQTYDNVIGRRREGEVDGGEREAEQAEDKSRKCAWAVAGQIDGGVMGAYCRTSLGIREVYHGKIELHIY